MSEYTECNYCTLKRMRQRAEAEHRRIVLMADPMGSWGAAMGVYAIPRGKKFKDMNDEERQQCRRAWMAEIPTRCEC